MPTTTAPFVLATAALAAGGSIGYYLASLQDGSTQTLTTTTFDGKHAEYRPRASGQVFDIVVPSQPVVKSTHAKLTSAEIEAFLKANETSIPVRDRPGNPILRWDTNIVPANPVCEDRITIDLVGKDDIDELIHASTPFWPRWREIRTKALSIVGPWQKILPQVSPGAGDKDVSFFSVFDGHGGISTVDHISKVLHPTLARALGRSTLREQDASALTDVIQKTYLALDDDMQQASLNVVTTPPHKLDTDTSLLPYPPPSEHLHGSTEYMGTTALTAVVDAEADVVHVINVADCRAVAGWYSPLTGKWRAQVLNREHSPMDPDEEARIYAEHPGEEGQAIYSKKAKDPMIMGFAEMSRVFGDAHLKRSAADSKLVQDALDTRTGFPIKPYKTPPYSTAKPDVVSTPLRRDNGEEIKFIIMGTDGLWARMSPEEACLLTAAQLGHVGAAQGGQIPKSHLTAMIPFEPPQQPRPWPQADLPCTTPENSKGVWVFKDKDNAATHLVRNCLTRGDDQLLQLSLSARGGLTRRMRDDTAAVVVFFR